VPYDPIAIKEKLAKIKDQYPVNVFSNPPVQVLTHNSLADLFSGDAIKNIVTTDNVYTKTQVDQKILDVATGGGVDLSNYYTKTDIDQQMNNVNTSITTNASNLTNYMGSNNSRLTSDENNISALQTDNTTNKANIGTNTSNINSLTNRMGTAESGISTANSNITSLSTRMTTAEGNITTNANAISNTYTKAQSDSKYALLGAETKAVWGNLTGTLSSQTDLNTALNNKVDKTGSVSSVAGRTGAVTLTSSDVGLGNVTNESKATMFSSPTFTGTATAGTLNATTLQKGGASLDTLYAPLTNANAWNVFTLQNSWVAFGGTFAPPSYRKNQIGQVEIKGVCKSGTMTSGTTVIMNLPAGYRPLEDKIIMVDTNDGTNDVLGRVHIKAATGDIVYYKGANSHFSFDAVPPFSIN
jgi:hypothetical protein